MKYLGFILANIVRDKTRLLFLAASIVSAFMLFGALSAVGVFFRGGYRFSDNVRIFIYPKYTNTLPMSYVEQIRRIPGLRHRQVDFTISRGAYYQDRKNPLGPLAMNEDFPQAPDTTGRFIWDLEQVRAYRADLQGALVNEFMARKYGWKLGDVVPITIPSITKLDGTHVFNFTIRGIWHYRDPAEGHYQFYCHYTYVDQSRATDRGTIDFAVAILRNGVDPSRFAHSVDRLFMNSGAETLSGTQDGLQRDYFRRIGNVSRIAYLILAAVFLTMLLATGNSLTQSFRERTREIGTLKALGFGPQRIWWLVMTEANLLLLVGGGLGLLAALWLIHAAQRQIGGLELSGAQLFAGVALMVASGCLVGWFPARRAARLTVVEAIRTDRR
ncbi:MAG TPA: ABC transporter permease [Steroidobacteraceae bacterium]|nr:ABC transporter permease [Steroidobacteraceae bacterium]